MTETRQLAEDMLKAINEGSGSARALVVTLLVLAIYVFIVVSGTDDEQLLRNSTVAVPTLSNATVPASAFYAVMPWAFVFLHLDLLIHLSLLSEKLHRFNEAVEGLEDPDMARDLRLRLAGFPFSNWLGRDPHSSAGLRRLQGVTVWSSLVLLPLLALIYLQLGFLAFHSEAITWGQRLALLLDVGLLYYFWPRLVEGRYAPAKADTPSPARRVRRWRFRPRLPAWLAGLKGWAPLAALILLVDLARAALIWLLRRLWLPALALLALPLLFISLLVATIPDERMDKLARWGMGEFSGPRAESSAERDAECRAAAWGRVKKCDQLSLPEHLAVTTPTLVFFHTNRSWFHRTLTVRERVLATDNLRPEVLIKVRSTLRDMQEGKEKTAGEQTPMRVYEDAIYEVRGLNLRERDLRYADFSDSSFPGAQLYKAEMNHAQLENVDLRNASMEQSQLLGAKLSRATLTGAKLSKATLTGADLSDAMLTGANLSGATLTGAYLFGATLIGADLSGEDTTLTGAYLIGATLTGAKLSRATLTGADLSQATLTGADLNHATLTGADLGLATLTGADLSHATLTGAYLNYATLTGADLSHASQGGMNLGPKPITGVLSRADLDGAVKTLQHQGVELAMLEWIKAMLGARLGEETTGLDFNACLGESCDPNRAQHNAKAWASVFREMACPGIEGINPWHAILRLKFRKTTACLICSRNLSSHIRTAAREALLDLARGPCADDLAKHIPDDIRAEAQQNKPRSP